MRCAVPKLAVAASFKSALLAVLLSIVVVPPLHTQPSCSVSGPDSVFFDKIQYNKYLPSSFRITVTISNPGTVRVDSVVVFPRSNQRFTVVAPAAMLVADELEPGDSAIASFELIVNPRSQSGFDTIVVAVSGKSGMRAECLCILWVEKEYRPMNAILCPPDSLLRIVFVDSLDDYHPNPLMLPVSVTNIGDAPSKESRLYYIATPGLAPADGQDPSLDIGTIPQNGGHIDRTFSLRVVQRETDTTVTVRFKAQGKGGPGDQIIDTVCERSLFIPAVRRVVFSASCANAIRIEYTNGAYIPNPFLWNATVRNSGNATARKTRAAISLPPHYILDSLEAVEKIIGDIPPGEERSVSWRVRAELLTRPDTSAICVRFSDEFNRNASCCDILILPSTRTPELRATCLVIPDSISIQAGTGEYQPGEFSAEIVVSNTGTDHADSVNAEIIISDPDIFFIAPTTREQFVGDRLDPNDIARVVWRLAPAPRPYPRDVTIGFRIRSAGMRDVTSICHIHIAASLQPALSCTMWTTPNDTLHFNASTLEYDSQTVWAEVINTGTIAATNVQATILLPPLTGLASGENPIVSLTSGPLGTTDRWRLAWRLQPLKQRDGRLDTIRVEFRSNDKRTLCEDWIFIIGIPQVTVLSIPVNNVNNYGRSLRIPIEIDNTDNKSIASLRVAVEYDTTKVAFTGFDRKSSLLENWAFTPEDSPGRAVFTASSDTAVLRGEGALVYMGFRVLYGLGKNLLNVSGSGLDFDTLASSVNRGTIVTRYLNGFIVVSGDCLPPLNATERYILVTSSPNPTQGSTTLSIESPQRGMLRIQFVDAFGRTLHLATPRFIEAGLTQLTFDGSALPSGVYYCRCVVNESLVGTAKIAVR
jgi:hypothetical protein